MNKKFEDPKILMPLGVFITNIGNGMNTLALGKLLYDQTGAVSAFAFVLFAKNILTFLTQAFASTTVDRGRAKQSAFVAEWIRGIVLIVCSLLAKSGSVGIIVFGSILISLLGPFYRTASFAIGPMIADGPNLVKYNARTSTAFQIGQLLGAGLAGLIMSVYSPIVILFFNGVSYLLSAACIGLSKIPTQSLITKEGKGISSMLLSLSPQKFIIEWKDLFINLKENPLTVTIIALGVIDLVIISLINISYIPILDRMNSATWWISIWDSAFAFGAILGAILYGNKKNLYFPLKITYLFLVTQAFLLTSLILDSTILVTISMLVIGLSNAYSVSSFNYTLQKYASRMFHGRISGVRQLTTTIILSLFLPILSFLLNLNITYAVLFVTAITLFVSLIVHILGNKIVIEVHEKREHA